MTDDLPYGQPDGSPSAAGGSGGEHWAQGPSPADAASPGPASAVPTPPGPGAWSADVLPPGPEVPAGKGKRRWRWTAAVAGVAVAFVAAGTAVAAYRLTAHQGGDRIDSLAPATTVFYVKVNVSPGGSAGTDVGAFARHVPALSGVTDARTLRDWVVRRALGGYAAEYDAMVKPWLGDEVAIGVFPSGQERHSFALLHVTDAAKAEQALGGLAALVKSRNNPGNDLAYRITDGFAVVTDSPAALNDLLADVPHQSLANQRTYTTDVASLGSGHLVVGWADLAAASRLAMDEAKALGAAGSLLGSVDTAAAQGRLVFAGTVHATSLDLDARVLGATATTAPLADLSGMLGRLPADTQLGVALAGPDQVLKSLFGRLSSDPLTSAFLGNQLGSLQSQTDLHLPDDIYGYVGSALAIGISRPAGAANKPQDADITLLTEPTDSAAATRVAAALRGWAAGGRALTVTPGHPFVISTKPQPLAGPALRDDPLYRAATDGMPSRVIAAGYLAVPREPGTNSSTDAGSGGGLGFYVVPGGDSSVVAHLRLVFR